MLQIPALAERPAFTLSCNIIPNYWLSNFGALFIFAVPVPPPPPSRQESPRGGARQNLATGCPKQTASRPSPTTMAPLSSRPLLRLDFNATRKTPSPALRTAPRLHRPPLGPRTPPALLPGQQPAPRTCRRVPEERSAELSQTSAFLRLPRSPRRRGDTGRGSDRGPQAASSRPAGSAARRPPPPPPVPASRPAAPPPGLPGCRAPPPPAAAGAPLAPQREESGARRRRQGWGRGSPDRPRTPAAASLPPGAGPARRC